jgi:hypothetical protein
VVFPVQVACDAQASIPHRVRGAAARVSLSAAGVVVALEVAGPDVVIVLVVTQHVVRGGAVALRPMGRTGMAAGSPDRSAAHGIAAYATSDAG